jgi:DnaJ-class molecular chaperone
MKNYYEILGITRDASPTDIKRAYRKLASQHHPDKGGDKNKFQEVEEAYRILGDNQKRAEYDNPQRTRGFNPGFGFQNNGFDFETIFDIFGARFQHPHAQQRRAQQAMLTLWITLKDSAQGGRKQISVGTSQGTNTIEIEIPKAINDGESVQYNGIGPGGIDLVITYRIHPEAKWNRNGLTLQTDEIISIWDLILGTEFPVKDISGNTLNLTVPAGTQPGTVLRLRGKGLTDRAGRTGDFLVKLQARIPEQIPEELLEHINQIRSQ